MAQMHCPNCGAPIMDPNAHFCGNCGRALPAGMNPVSQMKPKENKASVEGKPDPEIKATPAPAPATPVKEAAAAAVEKPEARAEKETQPVVPTEPKKVSTFPDIAPEGTESPDPAQVMKEHTGPLPQPEIPYTSAYKHNKDDGFSDPSFRGMFFSFHGRLNRKRYFWRSVTIFGLILAGIVGAVIFFGMVEAMGEGMEFLMIPATIGLMALWLGAVISGISLQIRRMQDLGWAPGAVYGYVAASIAWAFIDPLLAAGAEADPSGVWGSLQIAGGLFFLIIGLILWFKKGTTGPNAYGPDPLEKTERNNGRI